MAALSDIDIKITITQLPHVRDPEVGKILSGKTLLACRRNTLVGLYFYRVPWQCLHLMRDLIVVYPQVSARGNISERKSTRSGPRAEPQLSGYAPRGGCITSRGGTDDDKYKSSH
jgi:hypothetical protein